MSDAARWHPMTPEADERTADTVQRERRRLERFIRQRVPDHADAEDVLQDVLYALVEANRMLMPFEHVTGWLFPVARNRITDLFRKRRPLPLGEAAADAEEGEEPSLGEMLPSPDDGPDALYARNLLLDEIAAALEALPAEQREVFVAHELEGRSFREMAAQTGVGINTLLSRKRYAVLRLRERLQDVYEEYTR